MMFTRVSLGCCGLPCAASQARRACCIPPSPVGHQKHTAGGRHAEPRTDLDLLDLFVDQLRPLVRRLLIRGLQPVAGMHRAVF